MTKENKEDKFYDLRTVSWGDPDKDPEKWLKNYYNFIGNMNCQYNKTMDECEENH